MAGTGVLALERVAVVTCVTHDGESGKCIGCAGRSVSGYLSSAGVRGASTKFGGGAGCRGGSGEHWGKRSYDLASVIRNSSANHQFSEFSRSFDHSPPKITNMAMYVTLRQKRGDDIGESDDDN